MGGSFEYAYGVNSGWIPIGEFGRVTKSHKNIIYEIDHRPALEFYESVLGEGARPTTELPIAVYDSDKSQRFLRTTIGNFDLQKGSITYLGNVPEESFVKITVVNRDDILKGVRTATSYAVENFACGHSPSIALCYSCDARRVLLGTRTKEEFKIVT